jgi:uncharacterized protein with GYD domain
MIRPQLANQTGGDMPHYLQQVAYSQQGWEALVANPQNRIEAVRPAIEKLGGKIEAAWFSFGDYDVVVITDLPDNVSAAAIAMAFAAGGACKSVQTIPLISPEEATQALRKARECGYRPATTTSRAA